MTYDVLGTDAIGRRIRFERIGIAITGTVYDYRDGHYFITADAPWPAQGQPYVVWDQDQTARLARP